MVLDELNQQEANLALYLLRKSSIEAHKDVHPSKKNNLYQIKVKKNQAEKALSILIANHLPKINRAGLKEVYPPGSSALIPTKSDEMARLIMANQGEVEGLLKIIPGILDARVVLAFEQSELGRASPKKTASVAIIYNLQENGDPPLEDHEVKALLSSSISGLLPEDVAVIQKLSSEPTAIHTTNQTEEPHDTSLILTIIALIIAGYSAMRLLWHKRKDFNVKKTSPHQ